MEKVQMSARFGRIRKPGLRRRVFAAIRRLARGSDGKTAFSQVKTFYRDGGREWARCFN